MRNNDYKFNPKFSQRMVKISDKDIIKITDNFELPKGIKWNFDENYFLNCPYLMYFQKIYLIFLNGHQ